MKYIETSEANEIVIEKSRFITSIYKVSSIEEVNDILASVRKKYYDATHNCYAYILEEGKIAKAYDDGEPSKTAGFPILDVLKKNDLDNVLCIVTRYFGGILLGAGGLTRAYSQSAASVLKKVKFFEKLYLNKIIISIDYKEYNALKTNLKCSILDESFQSNVNMTLGIKDEDYKDQIDLINNITKGNALIEVVGKYQIYVPIN